MLYSLDLHIINNKYGILNAIKNLLPNNTDSRVWPNQYTLNESVTDNGDKYISVSIRFYDINERSGVLNSVKGVQGVLRQCLSGSYIRTHLCSHKWNEENPSDQKECEIENIEVP